MPSDDDGREEFLEFPASLASRSSTLATNSSFLALKTPTSTTSSSYVGAAPEEEDGTPQPCHHQLERQPDPPTT